MAFSPLPSSLEEALKEIKMWREKYRAQRKPLTDDEMYLAIRPLFRTDALATAALKMGKDEYRAIEAAHGIKGDA